MRTNIDIDDGLMAAALRAGPYKTKKDAVEAGLALLARQAAYRELLQWQGRLHWDDQAVPEVAEAPPPARPSALNERPPTYRARTGAAAKPARAKARRAPTGRRST